MKIVITGVLGMIGSALAEHLLLAGHAIIGIDYRGATPYLTSSPEDDYYKNIRYKTLSKYEEFAYINLDLANPEAYVYLDKHLIRNKYPYRTNHYSDLSSPSPPVRVGIRDFLKTMPYCEAVVHLCSTNNAGKHHLTLSANTHSLSVALEMARITKSKFLYGSGSSIYGTRSHEPEETPVSLLQPLSAEGQSKLMGESMCEYYHRVHGVNVLVMRLFNTYGRYNRSDELTHHILKSLYLGQELTLENLGENVRGFMFADDCVQIIKTLIEFDLFYGYHVLNIGNENSLSAKDYVSVFERIADKQIDKLLLPPKDIDDGIVEPEFLECQNHKMRTMLEPDIEIIWTPIEEGVRWCIESYLNTLHSLPVLEIIEEQD